MEWLELGWVDIAMVAIVAISALIGALRGLTFEVLSLAGWVAAWFAGLWLGPWLEPYLAIGGAGSALNAVVSFACAFVGVLLLWGLLARAVSALVGRTLLRPLDRLLGAVFGLLRGGVVLLAIAFVVGYTPLAGVPAWQDSVGAVWLNAILRELVPYVAPRPGERPAEQTV